jgi:biotin operon repressor
MKCQNDSRRAIVCFVASESLHDLRKEMFLSRNFGSEGNVFPNVYRRPVSARSIQTNIKMSRETARRKIKKLSEKGFIQKVRGGYILPAQSDIDDYTADLRIFIVNKLEMLKNYIDKTPE